MAELHGACKPNLQEGDTWIANDVINGFQDIIFQNDDMHSQSYDDEFRGMYYAKANLEKTLEKIRDLVLYMDKPKSLGNLLLDQDFLDKTLKLYKWELAVTNNEQKGINALYYE